MDLNVMRATMVELESYRNLVSHQALRAVIDDTRTWLSGNIESFNSDGGRVTRPWWPSLKRTDNWTLRWIRRLDLDARVWEHGLQQMLHRLARKSDVIRTGADRKAKVRMRKTRKNEFNLFAHIATDPMTSVVIREMVKFKLGHETQLRATPTATLAHIRDLHRSGADQRGQNVRDRLLELALFGLILMNLEVRSYSIEIGPAGWAFFNDVYLPVTEHADSYISGKEEV